MIFFLFYPTRKVVQEIFSLNGEITINCDRLKNHDKIIYQNKILFSFGFAVYISKQKTIITDFVIFFIFDIKAKFCLLFL